MMAPPERGPERDAALLAMLPHVPFDGWSRRALAMGLTDLGAPPDEVDLLFPGGALAMVEAFCDLADRRMTEAAAALDLSGKGLTARVRTVIALRLAQARPHQEAVRRAVAVLALPLHARQAVGCTARTVDAIWYAAGDRSADFSWYTKRAILTAVYGATLLYWLRGVPGNPALGNHAPGNQALGNHTPGNHTLGNQGAGEELDHASNQGSDQRMDGFGVTDANDVDGETLAFLDRRLAGIGRFGKLRSRAGAALRRVTPALHRPA
jgi:ubiquinone biosynthesis protein COQ9